MSGVAVTGGNAVLHNAEYVHMIPVIAVLEEMGCSFSCDGNDICMTAPERLSSSGYIRTMPYPGFPTDAQAIIMAASCVADGTSVFVENIFDSRFKHAGELCRLGAKIKTEGRVAVVEGQKKLTGATVTSTDLRGGASLVVAGLAAEGETVVKNLHHIDRGYQSMTEKWAMLGADIVRK